MNMLYRSMRKAANQFNDYNIRNYVLRRIGEDFRKPIQDKSKVNQQIKFAKEQLELIKRQVTIRNMYTNEKNSLVIDNVEKIKALKLGGSASSTKTSQKL